MAGRHGRVLSELTELGLSVARDLEARCRSAASREDAEGLALAFHRIARSVRLTLALEARLERDRRSGWRDERAHAAHRVQVRKAQVRAALARCVYTEREADEAEALLDEVEERLEDDALFDAFLEGPVEACIARIRKDLGLPPDPPANDQAPPEPRLTRSG